MEINLHTASPSTETLADFEPRNKLRVSGVELRQSTADLPGPGLFYTLLGLIVNCQLGSQPKLVELGSSRASLRIWAASRFMPTIYIDWQRSLCRFGLGHEHHIAAPLTP
jgi:hypothetical protein